MRNIFIGIVFGMTVTIALTYLFPRNIRACNEEMVRAGLAYYNTHRGIEWKEIK